MDSIMGLVMGSVNFSHRPDQMSQGSYVSRIAQSSEILKLQPEGRLNVWSKKAFPPFLPLLPSRLEQTSSHLWHPAGTLPQLKHFDEGKCGQLVILGELNFCLPTLDFMKSSSFSSDILYILCAEFFLIFLVRNWVLVFSETFSFMRGKYSFKVSLDVLMTSSLCAY